MWEQSLLVLLKKTNDFLCKFPMNSEEVKGEKNLIGGIDERQKNDLSIDAYIYFSIVARKRNAMRWCS